MRERPLLAPARFGAAPAPRPLLPRRAGPVLLALSAAAAAAPLASPGLAALVAAPAPPRALWWWSALPALWACQVALHEAGHAAAALLAGLRLDEIAASGFRVVRAGGGLRAGFCPRAPLFGGHVVARARGRRLLPLRFAAHVAAGPAASLAAAAACAAGALRASGPLRDLLAIAALAGAWALASALLPPAVLRLDTGTDAALLAAAVRGQWACTPAGLRAAAALTSGARVRDWEPGTAELARAAETARGDGGWASLLAAARALEDGEHALARRLLFRRARGEAPEVRRERLLQATLLAALVDGDAARARGALEEASALGAGAYGGLAEAALLAAEGRPRRAAAARQAWLEAAEGADPAPRRARDPEWYVGNHWALEALEDRLRVRAAG